MTTPSIRTLADDLTSFSANFRMFSSYRESIMRILPEMRVAGHDTQWFETEWADVQAAYLAQGSPDKNDTRANRILHDRVQRLAREIQIVAYDSPPDKGAVEGVICTCPHGWFPADVREQLQMLPHGHQGALAHHYSCVKRR